MPFLDAPITLGLIAANIILSLLAFQNRRFMADNLFVVGPIIHKRQYQRLITSGFLHGNFMHLAMNMYVLFIMGIQLEPLLGQTRFAILYTLSLLGGSFWSLLEHFRKPSYSALGASGATSGLLLVFCLIYPTVWFTFPPLPAWVLALGFFAVSAWLARRPDTVIGHDAHLGGMMAGAAYILLIAPSIWPNFTGAIEKSIGLG